MLANASKQEDLRAEPAAPFLMKAHLTALIGGTSVGGEYSMNWSAQDRWREALILADFTRIREGAEGGYNQVPSLDLQPQIIFAIDQALDVHSLLRLSPTETVKKIHKRKIAGVELSCVSVYAKDVERRELCFDATSGLLVRLEVKNSSSGFDGLSSVDYSGFLTLGARKFPSKLVISRTRFSTTIAVAQVDSFSPPEPSARPPAPPNSQFWRDCRDAIPPELVQQTPPAYPGESKSNHEQGLVSLYLRIETDGSVSHLTILQAPSPALGQASVDAVKHWKYKPRTCGGVPATDETVLQVTYTLGY
jgi:TonB family protein